MGEFQDMLNITRRQALAASGGLVGTLLVPQRFASAAPALSEEVSNG